MSVVSLIRPPTLVAKWAHTTPTCPPLGLAYLAGALAKAGHSVHAVDAVGAAPQSYVPTPDPRFLSHGLDLESIVQRVQADTTVIGVSIMFSHEWPWIRDLLALLRGRFPDALIAAGGEHVTALPEFSLDECQAIDVIVVGEGEETFCDLIAAHEAGAALESVEGIFYRTDDGAAETPARKRIRAIDDIPEPDWTIFPLEAYLHNGFGFGVNRGRSMPILATRGCPYQCTFCSNPTMWGTRWVARSPQQVFDEMMAYKKTYKIDNFDFYDLTAIVKKDWVVKFTDIILESGEKFTWQLPSGTRSEAIDEEVSDRLYATGCRNMSYAPESGSMKTLVRIKKKIKLGPMKKSMRDAVRKNINCKANIIIGFPDETHRDIWQTLWFSMQMAAIGVHDMSISPFSPYPGSELFDDMRADGKIPTLDDHYFFSLASYTDITSTQSCSEHVSNRALGIYRILGMAAFYMVSYLARPSRMFVTLRNDFREHQESRLEMSLRDLYLRVMKKAQ